jgi:hypothetical protein
MMTKKLKGKKRVIVFARFVEFIDKVKMMQLRELDNDIFSLLIIQFLYNFIKWFDSLNI